MIIDQTNELHDARTVAASSKKHLELITEDYILEVNGNRYGWEWVDRRDKSIRTHMRVSMINGKLDDAYPVYRQW